MLTADYLRSKFESGLPYEKYVATGSPDQRANWARVHDRAELHPQHRAVLSGFTRHMNVLVTSGLWCGDCAQQCPLFARIAEASPAPLEKEHGGRTRLIDLRFVDRDEHMDLSDQVKLCGGHRVPTVIFLAEDFELCGFLGDRSLSRYRAIASRQLGAACPLPGAPLDQDELDATLQDWVNEFERIHLMLRLSPRLRQKHAD